MSRFLLRAVSDGQVLEDGSVYLAASQAELARRYEVSAGTVAWHVRKLRTAISLRGGVVLDPAALADIDTSTARQLEAVAALLADRWGRPSRHGIRLVTEDGSKPSAEDVADELDVPVARAREHLDALRNAGRLRQLGDRMVLDNEAGEAKPDLFSAAIAAVRAASEALSIAVTCLEAAVEDSRATRGKSARTRESLATSKSSSVSEVDISLLTDLKTREPREPLATSTMSDQRLDELLAPLRSACARAGVSTYLDQRGRTALRRIEPEGLAAAVERLVPAVGQVRSPLGLLVARARERSSEFFTPAQPVSTHQQRSPRYGDPGTPPEPLYEEEDPNETCDQADIDALDDDQLAKLDQYIAAGAGGLSRMAHPGARAAQRRAHFADWQDEQLQVPVG